MTRIPGDAHSSTALPCFRLPVLLSCGHSAEAELARARILSTAADRAPTCGTCRAEIAPWAPLNRHLLPADATVPGRFSDVVLGFPALETVLRPPNHRAAGNYMAEPYLARAWDIELRKQARQCPDVEELRVAVKERATTRFFAEKYLEAAADVKLSCSLSGNALVYLRGVCRGLAAHGVDPATAPLGLSDFSIWPINVLPVDGGQSAPLHMAHAHLHDLLVPQVMFDPVALSCGHTFDRASWLAVLERHSALKMRYEPCCCPVCRIAVLPWHVPNLVVRDATDAFYLQHPEARPQLALAGIRAEGGLPLEMIDFPRLDAACTAILQEVQMTLAAAATAPGTYGGVANLDGHIRALGDALALNPRRADVRALRAALQAARGDATRCREDLADCGAALAPDPARVALHNLHRACGPDAVLDAVLELRQQPEMTGLALEMAATMLAGDGPISWARIPEVIGLTAAAVDPTRGGHGADGIDLDGGRCAVLSLVLARLRDRGGPVAEVVAAPAQQALLLEAAARTTAGAREALALASGGDEGAGPADTALLAVRRALLGAVAAAVTTEDSPGPDWHTRSAWLQAAAAQARAGDIVTGGAADAASHGLSDAAWLQIGAETQRLARVARAERRRDDAAALLAATRRPGRSRSEPAAPRSHAPAWTCGLAPNLPFFLPAPVTDVAVDDGPTATAAGARHDNYVAMAHRALSPERLTALQAGRAAAIAAAVQTGSRARVFWATALHDMFAGAGAGATINWPIRYVFGAGAPNDGIAGDVTASGAARGTGVGALLRACVQAVAIGAGAISLVTQGCLVGVLGACGLTYGVFGGLANLVRMRAPEASGVSASEP